MEGRIMEVLLYCVLLLEGGLKYIIILIVWVLGVVLGVVDLVPKEVGHDS